MVKSQQVGDRRTDLSDVACQPVRAQLRPTLPTYLVERRNVSSRHALVLRVHSEFSEMPGLTLSIEPAARLFSLQTDICARILGEMVQDELLRTTPGGPLCARPAHRMREALDDAWRYYSKSAKDSQSRH